MKLIRKSVLNWYELKERPAKKICGLRGRPGKLALSSDRVLVRAAPAIDQRKYEKPKRVLDIESLHAFSEVWIKRSVKNTRFFSFLPDTI